jgi:hypothetical protein
MYVAATDNNEFLVLSLQYTCHSVIVTVLTQIFIAFQEYQLPDSQAISQDFMLGGARESMGYRLNLGLRSRGRIMPPRTAKPCWGWVREGSPLPPWGSGGITPGKFLK